MVTQMVTQMVISDGNSVYQMVTKKKLHAWEVTSVIPVKGIQIVLQQSKTFHTLPVFLLTCAIYYWVPQVLPQICSVIVCICIGKVS